MAEEVIIVDGDSGYGIQNIELTSDGGSGIDGIEMGEKLRKLSYIELGNIYGYDTIEEIVAHYSFEEIVEKYYKASIVEPGNVIVETATGRKLVVTYVNIENLVVMGVYRDTGEVETVKNFEDWSNTFEEVKLDNILDVSEGGNG